MSSDSICPAVGSGASRSGQVSMEYIMVMAAMLLVLTLLIVIFNGIYSQQALRSQYLQGQNALTDLSASATEVWAGGPGASEEVTIDLPPITNLTGSTFTSSLMDLSLFGFGDVSTTTPFPINGTWPVQYGRTLMSVYNNGTAVLIRPSGRFVANLTGIYLGFTSGNWAITYLGMRNQANVTYNLTETLHCPAAATCTFNASGSYLLPSQANQTASLNITSSTTGLSTGYLQLDLVPASGSGLPNETNIIPITIKVS